VIELASFTNKQCPRLLLVASNGGPLEQMARLADASEISPASVFVTFDSPQARFLIGSRPHIFVPEIGQRDWKGVAAGIVRFRRILEAEDVDGVVSTGAAIALPAFIAARLNGIPTLYVESVSRVYGPSLTGRLLDKTRLAGSRWCQHPGWNHPRWKYKGSVLEAYASQPRPDRAPDRLFVTLGTLRRYPFPALLESVLRTGIANEQTIWQLGCTQPRIPLPGSQYDFISTASFDQFATTSDVVVSHAGVGSVLRLLSLGIYPILITRRKSRGEQIDDHQTQIGELIAANDLGIVREPEDLTQSDFYRAARRCVAPVSKHEDVS